MALKRKRKALQREDLVVTLVVVALFVGCVVFAILWVLSCLVLIMSI